LIPVDTEAWDQVRVLIWKHRTNNSKCLDVIEIFKEVLEKEEAINKYKKNSQRIQRKTKFSLNFKFFKRGNG
jgi:hypothetical protein